MLKNGEAALILSAAIQWNYDNTKIEPNLKYMTSVCINRASETLVVTLIDCKIVHIN